MIGFKTLRQLREWYDADPRLREMIEEAYDTVWPANIDLIVMDIYRTPTENAEVGATTTIHVTPVGEQHRAADVRNRLLPDQVSASVCAWVNARWVYDAARPTLVCAYDAPHGTGPHIHFQVHPGTVRRSLHV